MKSSFSCTLVLIILLFSFEASAGLFKITNRPSGLDTLFNDLENQINAKLPDADPKTYLNGMSNSEIMSTKGLGVDYASNPTLFVVGAAVGAGADLGSNTFSDLTDDKVDFNQIRGVGLSTTVMLGLNLGMLDFLTEEIWGIELERLTLFANFMKMDLPKIDEAKGDIANLGFHLQYKYIEPIGLLHGLLIEWGGVDFTAGIEFSKMKVTYERKFAKTVNYDGNDLTYNGTASVGMDTTTVSIPIEASTNIRLLYFLTLFGGAGVDISSGSTDPISNITGTISSNSLGGGLGTPTPELDLGKGKPDNFLLRGFAGLQINILPVKIFVQYNKAFTNDTIGLAAGLRVAW